ncbi:MAG: DUF3047 domain-containing protein [Amphritea sp.]
MNHLRISIVTIILLTLSTPSVYASKQIPAFTQTDISQWLEQSFAGSTRYQLITDETGPVLMAKSEATASGLYFKKTLSITPDTTLEWRWKIGNIYQNIDERSKAGDDFPARIYVIVSDGPFFWQKRTLVYVWSSYQPIDTRWVNPFTSRAIMWAVESGAEKQNQWISYHRNLYWDLKTVFGRHYNQIEAIAIMSDSDNSQQSATAWYGDISLK